MEALAIPGLSSSLGSQSRIHGPVAGGRVHASLEVKVSMQLQAGVRLRYGVSLDV